MKKCCCWTAFHPFICLLCKSFILKSSYHLPKPRFCLFKFYCITLLYALKERSKDFFNFDLNTFITFKEKISFTYYFGKKTAMILGFCVTDISVYLSQSEGYRDTKEGRWHTVVDVLGCLCILLTPRILHRYFLLLDPILLALQSMYGITNKAILRDCWVAVMHLFLLYDEKHMCSFFSQLFCDIEIAHRSSPGHCLIRMA